MRSCLLLTLPFLVLSTLAVEPPVARGNWMMATVYTGDPPLREPDIKRLNSTDDGARQLKDSVTLKGLVVRVGENAAYCFDTQHPHISAAWTGGFVTPVRLMSRGEFPTPLGKIAFTQKTSAAAMAGRWHGFYVHGSTVVLSYSLGEEHLLEYLDFNVADNAFYRNVKSSRDGHYRARIDQPENRILAKKDHDEFEDFTRGGALNWSETIETRGSPGRDDGPYSVDTLTVPYKNPYKEEFLLAGMDFFPDGRAALCTFHGDVWIVSGIDASLEHLKWKRYAAGLYHALGLKIVNNQVYVTGRDQITRLHDLNNDGEADFYENFNNDVQITSNFHEFVFDLQTDAPGNFYFTKAGPVRNGGRGFQELVAHHGCLLKLTPDGKTLSVVATGFRAPNGIGVGPNGELSSGDNEGTWMPVCRLNAIKPGGFYGVPPTSHRNPPPSDYDKPICWFPKDVDNSSGGQVWDTTAGKFGPFAGHMLHLSYGTCSLFHVLSEEIDGVQQGGVVRFPVQLNTGIMRARFGPRDNALYLCGLKGWQTSAAQTGGFQRVRYTGKTVTMPLSMHVQRNGIKLTFTSALDPESAADLQNYGIEQWNYIWSESYGSPDISAKKNAALKSEEGKEWSKAQMAVRQRDTVAIKTATLLDDKKTVFLEIPEIQPVMQLQLKYNLKSADGSTVRQDLIMTINALGAR